MAKKKQWFYIFIGPDSKHGDELVQFLRERSALIYEHTHGGRHWHCLYHTEHFECCWPGVTYIPTNNPGAMLRDIREKR